MSDLSKINSKLNQNAILLNAVMQFRRSLLEIKGLDFNAPLIKSLVENLDAVIFQYGSLSSVTESP